MATLPSQDRLHKLAQSNFFDDLKDYFKSLDRNLISDFNRDYTKDFESHCRSFDELKEIFPTVRNPADFIKQVMIDEFVRDNKTQSYLADLTLLCMHVNPGVLHEKFGEDFLIWLLNQYPYDDSNREKFHEYLNANTGLDAKLLQNAKYSYGHSTCSVSDVRLAYELGNGGKISLLTRSLIGLLEQNQQDGLPESVELNKFSVGTISLNTITCVQHKGRVKEWYTGAQKTRGNRYYDLYLDSPYGLTIKYDGNPVAVLGLKYKKGILEIHQIQAINPYEIIGGKPFHEVDGKYLPNKKLKPFGIYDEKKRRLVFDIRKLLVEMAERWAQIHGIEKVMIQGAHNNLYIRPIQNEPEPRLALDCAIKIYDKTAERLGYSYDNKSKNWFKNLAK